MSKYVKKRPALLSAGLFLPILLFLLVLYKSGYLSLPFYWDEAWSYATAIFDMHENGPVILQGNANTDLTRGHPLFFYFISSSWIRGFGTSPATVHLLPLLISCLLLIVLYYFCRDYFNPATAITALLFFTVQSVSLAQSTMLLPEVLLALLILSSIYGYFKNNWWLYILSGSLLVLTKETGIILIAAVLIDRLLIARTFPLKEKIPAKRFLREILIILIPAVIFAANLTYQKIRFGWWFYPEHMDLITVQGSQLLYKSRLFFSKLFLQNGRNIFLVVFAISLSGLLYNKALTDKEKHFLLFSILFVLLYGAFSVVNFFTARYILSALPLYMISGSVVISSFLDNWKTVRAIVAFGLAGLFAYYTWFGFRNESDVSLAYKDTVLMQKELVNDAEEMNWNDKLIYSAFLMQYYLSNPYLGYLNDKTAPFYEVSNLPDLPYDLYVFCSNENDPYYEKISGNDDYILVKRYERNKAWAEVYARIKAE
ncbi:MAG: glycosyltransferase family 39 protein [Bacteroidales bacterium]|nr:glycosyltransferase family 39 protein [Bacteroidales bacterium]